MSDSLNATVIVNVLVLMISAKPAPEDPEEPEEPEDPEPPRLPAVVPEPDPLLEEELEEDEEDEELPDPPPDTASPGVRLDSDAIVPLTGA